MKQPANRLKHSVGNNDRNMHYIDFISSDIDIDQGAIATATTKQAAWRKAVRRLERLLKEAKKKAGME